MIQRYVRFDEYGFRHFPRHLAYNHHFEKLRDLLLDFDWLQAKLEATGPQLLIKDYSLIPETGDKAASENKSLHIIERILRLSAQILVKDDKQLAGQLVGQLFSLDDANILSLIESAKRWEGSVWLCPLIYSLSRGGGPLLSSIWTGHGAPPTSVALTSDGSRAITVSEDGTAKVWDLSTDIGEETLSLRWHDEPILDAMILPNNLTVVSLSQSCLKVWNLESGELIQSMNLPLEDSNRAQGRCAGLAKYSDGRRIFFANMVGTFIFDLNTKKLILLERMPFGVRHLAITVTPDFKRGAMVESAWDHQIHDAVHYITVWDLDTCQHLPFADKNRYGEFEALAITADGRTLLGGAADGGYIELWNINTDATKDSKVLYGHDYTVTRIVTFPNDNKAISSSLDRTLRYWDLGNTEKSVVLQGHADIVADFAISSNGTRVVSVSADGIMNLWDLTQNHQVQAIPKHKGKINDLVLSPFGNYAVSTSSDGKPTRNDGYKKGSIRVWDMDTGLEHRLLADGEKPVNCARILPDRRRVVCGLESGDFLLWDIVSGERLLALKGKHGVNALDIMSDGQKAVAACCHTRWYHDDGNYIKIFDLEIGQELWAIEAHTELIHSVVVSPGGQIVVSASGDKTLAIWDISRRTVLHRLEGHTEAVTTVVITPEGRLAISAAGERDSSDLGLIIWDIASGKQVGILKGHESPVISMKISPDSRYLASGGWDLTVRVWDLLTGQAVIMKGHQFPVVSVCITSDSRYVISGSADQTIRVWDLNTGKTKAVFTGTGPITHCAVSIDNRIIAAGEWSGSVHFLRPKNLTFGPIIITPWLDGNTSAIAFGCHHCYKWQQVPQSALGSEIPCPNCGRVVKLNPFIIQGDWQTVSKAWLSTKPTLKKSCSE